MIIIRILLLPKIHTAAGPIGAEAAGLDQLQLDLPLRLQLHRDGLGKALDGKLGGIVHAEQGHADLAADRGDLLDQPALRPLRPHRLQRAPGHVDQAEEVDLHLLPDLALAERLEFAAQPVPGVVADDVDAAELLEGGVEGGVDGGPGGDVQIDGEEVGRGRVGEGELGAGAGGGGDVVAFGEDFFDVFVAAGLRLLVANSTVSLGLECWRTYKPVEQPVMKKTRGAIVDGGGLMGSID